MKPWIFSFISSVIIFAITFFVILLTISANAVEDDVSREMCCESHGGCTEGAGLIKECQHLQINKDDWEVRYSQGFRSGIPALVGLMFFVLMPIKFNGTKIWRTVLGGIIIAFSLCLLSAQGYVWIWQPPMY